MQFRDKLFQLRKRDGMTQAELAEAINVSRQAISKWEMGTAVPDVSNMLALSKVFGVSVDFLANDEMESESDAPVVKATAAVFKINYQYILARVIVAICIVAIVAMVGGITRSFASMVICLLIIGFVFLIHSLVRLLLLLFSNKRQ